MIHSRIAGTGGYLPAKVWNDLVQALPGATLVDVSPAFAELVLVKGEEELALVRYAARIGEAAAQAMAEVTRPGVGEFAVRGQRRVRLRHAHHHRPAHGARPVAAAHPPHKALEVGKLHDGRGGTAVQNGGDAVLIDVAAGGRAG